MDKKEKCSDRCCKCFDYQNLVFVDGFMLISHLCAAFVLYNGLMFASIIFIRVPRLILRFLETYLERSKKARAGTDGDKKLPCCAKGTLFLETWFRLISGVIFLIFCTSVQFSFIFFNFCDRYELKDNQSNCYLRFSLVMVCLIAINSVVDFLQWRTCNRKL